MNDDSKLARTPDTAANSNSERASPLRWRILRILAPLVFAICAISGIASYHLYASKAVEHMQDDQREMMDIVALTLPDAIWNFDDERVQAYLEALSHQDSVHAVRYFNQEGELVEEIVKEGTALEPATLSKNLIYQNSLVKQAVGKLELQSTNATLLAARYQGGAVLFAIALIIILLTLLTLSWQLKRYVAIPLNVAIDHMGQLEGQHDTFHRIPLTRSCEINRVIVQLNKLGERLFNMMEALRKNEERYQHFYRDTPALLLVIDSKGTVQDASEKMLEVTGWAREHLVGMCFRTLFSSQNGNHIHRINKALRLGNACNDLVMTLSCQHQEDRQVQLVIPASKGSQSKGTMILLTDITELTKTQQRLMEHQLIDPLTQLPNRLSLNQHVQQLIARDAVFGLLLVNIDRFHSINHHLGPIDGDLLLKEVSARLKECGPAWIGRIGGDEFVMTCDINDLRKIAHQIKTAFCTPLLKAGEPIDLSLSMAGLEAQANDESPSRLMRLLELTMVNIKHDGGNQYRTCVRDSALEDGEPLLLKERMIREALTMGWFRLYLQPIFRAASPDLDTPEMLGAEGLIRLEHPELGMVPPNEFIPAAEKTGQIVEIGNWVLEEAAVILCEWRRLGIEEHYLSINASVLQFRDQGMLSQLESLLERYPIRPSQLVIEVTENLMLDGKDSLHYQLQAIRKLGVNLSLDDFGTGFSCLSYLHKLPFGILKIDRSFVMNVETSHRDRELARVIVAMGQSLGMQVVVEGVEERGQAEFFKDLGVHAFQGFLFGRPMPQQAFEARFHSNADERVNLLKPVRSAPGKGHG